MSTANIPGRGRREIPSVSITLVAAILATLFLIVPAAQSVAAGTSSSVAGLQKAAALALKQQEAVQLQVSSILQQLSKDPNLAAGVQQAAAKQDKAQIATLFKQAGAKPRDLTILKVGSDGAIAYKVSSGDCYFETQGLACIIHESVVDHV